MKRLNRFYVIYLGWVNLYKAAKVDGYIDWPCWFSMFVTTFKYLIG